MKVKVILSQDIKNLGKAMEIVQVKDGFGIYLINNKMAILATPKAIALNQKKIKAAAELALEKFKYLTKVKEELTNFVAEFQLETHHDKVSKSITVQQICDYLHYNFNLDIGTRYKFNKHEFINFEPIRKIGITEVKVRLHPKIIATFKVEVKPKNTGA